MTDRYAELRAALAGKLTPGPWHVGGKDSTLIFPEDGYALADTKTWHCKHPEGAEQAHARLIAAANPDTIKALLAERDELLNVLVEIVAANRWTEGTNSEPAWYQDAAEVVAKARGEAP